MMNSKIFSILYIEDNRANQQLVELILERKNHLSLSLAADGTRGIELAKSLVPDLILLDISLPDMDGYEVLATLRNEKATKSIPVIALSGDLEKEPTADAPHTFANYLTKPIQLAPFYKAIDDLLPITV